MTTYAGADVYSGSATLPDDLAAPTGAEVDPFLEFLTDRTTWLKNRTGTHRLVAQGETLIDDAADAEAVAVAWTSTSYASSLLLIAAVGATVAGDIVEIEVDGTVSVAGDGTSRNRCWTRLTHDNGSVSTHLPASQKGLEQPYRLAFFVSPSVVDDGSTYPPQASWTGITWGTPFLLQTTSQLETYDIVDIDLSCRANASYSGGSHTTQLRAEVQENAAGNTAVAGARSLFYENGLDREVVYRIRHTMTADGTLNVYLNGEVDVATDSATMFVLAPTRVAVNVWRPGLPLQPMKLGGVYVVSGSGPTLNFRLDGRVETAGTTLSWLGAMTVRWRVWRSNA